MPAKPSGQIKTSIIKNLQKNGDTYILERKTIYDPEKKYTKVLSTKLIAKIPKGSEIPVPTRPKRGKNSNLDTKPEIVPAKRTHVGMVDIIDHISSVSGIDDAVYSSTDMGTAQKIISLARYLLATNVQSLPEILTWQYNHPLPYEKNRQPVAFTKQPGNLPDVTSVTNAINQLSALGVHTTEIITDNGYYSEQNFSELLLAGFDFITLAKISVRWIRPEIDKQRETLDDFRSVCPFDPSIHGVSVLLMHDFEKKRKYASHRSGVQKGEVATFTRRILTIPDSQQIKLHLSLTCLNSRHCSKPARLLTDYQILHRQRQKSTLL